MAWIEAHWLRDSIARTYMLLCRVLPVDKNKVVFKSDRGKQCTDSPLALFELMRKICPEYRLVWVLSDPNLVLEGATAVKEGSLAEIRALATAGYWIDNKRKGCWTIKRKGQIYIQTWHGAISIKKVEKDVQDKLPAYYVKSAKHDSAIADYFLSSCAWTSDFYRRSFWYDGSILEYGLPRSDVFYQKPKDLVEKIYRHYGLPEGERILLYAPTFRDDGSTDVYDIDYERLRRTLECCFGGSWRIILRMHPNLLGTIKTSQYSEYILNGNTVADINGLIIASEIIITDYSSVMFDGMEADKIVVLYASDVEKYRYDRGFIFSFEELPFTLTENNENLNKVLSNFDPDAYKNRIALFKQKLGFFETGHASESIIRTIFQNAKQENK